MSMTGYARVSTDEQNIDTQIEELRSVGCTVIYADHASGGTQDRPDWQACKRSLGEGDTLVVSRIDRLGRSLIDLVSIIDDLGARGIAFRSLHEGIDTSSTPGKMLFHLVASFAEYERSLIRERTKDGLAHARRRGIRVGRPPALTKAQQEEARRMRKNGYSLAQIASLLGASTSTIHRALNSS